MDKDFHMCNDASKNGIGVIMMQGGGFIPYTFSKLMDHEANYATHDLYWLE